MTETAKFLGYESMELESAIFSIIPAPYETDATYVAGQAGAPRAIIDASSQIEDYDEETGLVAIDHGIHCLSPEAAPQDESLETWVGDQVRAALDATAVPVILGGDGTVALWAVRTLLPKSDELSVLHVDAHADLSSAEDGLGETHHTVMRRILELSPAPHICQVGIRSLTRDGFDKIVEDDVSVECFFMSDIHRAADESWHEDVIQELRSPVYLSLDLSAFDPGVLPAVAHPEPGGLEWWPTLRLLRKIASRRRIAGMDISGLAPRPGVINSDYAAAKLAYKLMNYILAGGKMLDKEGPEIGEEEEYEEEESPFEE